MARVTKLETDLRRAFPNVDDKGIALALRLMRGKLDNHELEAIPAVRRRIDDCYHRPSRHDVTMHALNDILGTYGVEALGGVHVYDGPPFEYLNVGDRSKLATDGNDDVVTRAASIKAHYRAITTLQNMYHELTGRFLQE